MKGRSHRAQHIEHVAQYVNRTNIPDPPIFLSLCATCIAEGHPVTMWMATVHLRVQLCPHYPLCTTHILSAKRPAWRYAAPPAPAHPDFLLSRYPRAEIFIKVQLLSLWFIRGSSNTIKNSVRLLAASLHSNLDNKPQLKCQYLSSSH